MPSIANDLAEALSTVRRPARGGRSPPSLGLGAAAALRDSSKLIDFFEAADEVLCQFVAAKLHFTGSPAAQVGRSPLDAV